MGLYLRAPDGTYIRVDDGLGHLKLDAFDIIKAYTRHTTDKSLTGTLSTHIVGKTVTIDSGETVYTGERIRGILCTRLEIYGTLSANGYGAKGGSSPESETHGNPGESAGNGGGGGGADYDNHWYGGAGGDGETGSGGGAGGDAWSSTNAGGGGGSFAYITNVKYENLLSTVVDFSLRYTPYGAGGGSGGNYGGGAGGNGGGCIIIGCETLVLDGQITANGTNGGSYEGSSGAGGGGAGGCIVIFARYLEGTGTITAKGGNGGSSNHGGGGGGGAGGLVVIVTEETTNPYTVDVSGGVGGSGYYGDGGNGDDGQLLFKTYPI